MGEIASCRQSGDSLTLKYIHVAELAPLFEQLTVKRHLAPM
jgi:hypothetical protein